MNYIGIDPGVSGGIAALTPDGAVGVVLPMPDTVRDLLDALASVTLLGPVRAFLERVSSSPKMGVVSAFTFGKGYGRLEAALAASRIPYEEITPGKWQLVMGCLSKGDKNVTKRRAQQLFPHVTVTHAIADALLLAECCRRLDGRK